MAKVLKKVDAVVIGFGWTGAIMSKELVEAGLSVVALNAGRARYISSGLLSSEH